MLENKTHVGAPLSRVDGRAKVTGAARYAAEFNAPNLACGYAVSSAIAKGRITSIAVDAALAVPGVIKFFTHEDRPRTAWFDSSYKDEVAQPGSPFRPLYDEKILFSGQPVALVVADTFEIARYAASLVRIEYETELHAVEVKAKRQDAYKPPKKRSGVSGPPSPRGDAGQAFQSAPVHIESEYHVAVEHHNPMEMHASTVIFEGDGKITVYDKTQGVQNVQSYITSVFGLSESDVRVLSPFVGGAFGSGLRPQHQLFLAVMAALDLEHSVRVTLTRDQMFSLGYRPDTWHEVKLGANADGKLLALQHHAVAGTSTYEDYQEVVVNWSGLLYHCDNAEFSYKLTQIDTPTPMDMRAPGAPLGTFAIESAMDELAYATGTDPLELRLKKLC